MSCQNITYYRRYEPSNGHYFLIGGISKGVIGMVLYSMAWINFCAMYKRGEETEEQDCPNNFEGNSKIMEADVIMNMVEDVFRHHFLSLMSS